MHSGQPVIESNQLRVETLRASGKLRLRETIACHSRPTWWITLAPESEITAVSPGGLQVSARGMQKEVRVERWALKNERWYGRADMQPLLEDLKKEAGVVRLTDAEFIIDVGFGVGNRDGYEVVIEPLERKLCAGLMRRSQLRSPACTWTSAP